MSQTSTTASELHSALKENPNDYYLVDVRSPGEHRSAHLPGSDLRPIDSFNAEEAKAVKSAAGQKKVCFICQSGKRSQTAQKVWQKAGLEGAMQLDGGLNAWDREGLPLNKGQGSIIPLDRQVRIAAGALVFLGTLLGVFASSWFLIVPAFVGAGLVFAGVTDTCGMAMMLAKMPWNR